jgi:hypothetical protein
VIARRIHCTLELNRRRGAVVRHGLIYVLMR